MFIYKFLVGFVCLCLFITKALFKVDENCDSSSLNDDNCGHTEACDDESGKCVCLIDYQSIDGVCVLRNSAASNYSSLVDNQGDGSLMAGIFIPLSLIAFVICSVYMGRRFEVIKWLREKFVLRNRNYDEFMIGQDDDDPPLA